MPWPRIERPRTPCGVPRLGSGLARPGERSVKIAISLPEDTVARVRQAVRSGRAASASAYIAEAIRERVTRDDLADMLSGMLQETGGPLSAQERRHIDRELGTKRGRRRA